MRSGCTKKSIQITHIYLRRHQCWRLLVKLQPLLIHHPWRTSWESSKTFPLQTSEIRFISLSLLIHKIEVWTRSWSSGPKVIDFIQDSQFPRQVPQRCSLFKMSSSSSGSGPIWLRGCIEEEICKVFGWCLTMHTECKAGLQWHATSMTMFSVGSWLLFMQHAIWRFRFALFALVQHDQFHEKEQYVFGINFKGFMADSVQANYIAFGGCLVLEIPKNP